MKSVNKKLKDLVELFQDQRVNTETKPKGELLQGITTIRSH